jgi:hypothetical protein
MNLNQIIQMVTNIVLRKVIGKVVNAGIGFAARKGKAPADMTPEERADAARTLEITKRARKTARMARRLGR